MAVAVELAWLVAGACWSGGIPEGFCRGCWDVFCARAKLPPNAATSAKLHMCRLISVPPSSILGADASHFAKQPSRHEIRAPLQYGHTKGTRWLLSFDVSEAAGLAQRAENGESLVRRNLLCSNVNEEPIARPEKELGMRAAYLRIFETHADSGADFAAVCLDNGKYFQRVPSMSERIPAGPVFRQIR